MKKNIWLLKVGETLPIIDANRKMRTALLADKLTEKGHNVLWWTSAFDHFKKKWIFDEDKELIVSNCYKIIALRGKGYKKNISLARFIDHRLIARKFRILAQKKQKPDIIVTSTPPHDLAFEAVRFAKKNNIPVIVDIRDEWPDLIISYFPKMYQKIAKMFFFRDFHTIKKTMQNADGLTAVTDSFLQWGLQYAERIKTNRDRVFYIGHKRQMLDLGESSGSLVKKILNNLKDKFVVTFVGTFGYNNDPSILLDCAKELRDYNICFVLAGDGELMRELKKKAGSLQNVIFTGWLNGKEITTLLKCSHIGICPISRVRYTFSNKAFAYLSEGLPIISAFHGDLKETIEKYGIGYYYPPNDLKTLVSCIKKLYEDVDLYERMSKNALILFNNKFNADKIYEEFANHIIDKIYNMICKFFIYFICVKLIIK